MNIFDRLIKRASLKALKRLANDDTFQFLQKCHLFQDLSPDSLLFIHEKIIVRRYQQHEIIFREGNPGICLFLVKIGRVEIFTEENLEQLRDRTVFATVDVGRLFGELSTLSVTYRTTSARAIDPGTTLLTLSSYDLEGLLEQFPRDGLKVLRGITDTIAHNLIESNKVIRELEARNKALTERAKSHE